MLGFRLGGFQPRQIKNRQQNSRQSKRRKMMKISDRNKNLFNRRRAKKKFLNRFMVVWIVGLLVSSVTLGAINVYEGTDPSATNASGLFNSNAAQANFASAVELNLVIEDLESATIGGGRPNWTVGNLSFQRTGGSDSGILNEPGAGEFPVSGTNYAYSNGSVSTLTFGGYIDAFGAYFTDVGDFGGSLTMHFYDGSAQVLQMPNTLPGNSGGMFFGFTNFGAYITAIEIWNTNTSDFYGFDDVQWHVIPEPGTVTLLGLGALSLIRSKSRNVN
jgi:preprotein translocase subunit SecG